nr:hypothetical protein 6 [Bacillaceae bacterium]
MINRLLLLKGEPIPIEDLCTVHPLRLEEISVIGEETYNQYLSLLMIDKSALQVNHITDPDEIAELNKITGLDILIMYGKNQDEMCSLTCKALSTFLKEDVSYSPLGYFFIGDFIEDRIITYPLFEQIKTILKKQNYLNDKQEEKEFKPANDKASELIEKMKKVKEKMKNQNNEDGLALSDIVSIVSTYSSDINILTVWNLTIFQLYETYLRLIMWDEYHTNHFHLPHMDENARKDFKHWANKIN